MGNSASGGFDDTDGKSAASRRQENRALYEACIADLRAELKGSPRPAPLPLRCADDASRPRIVLRKRPLFERERASDFDVLSGDGDDDVWGSGPAAALWVTRPMLGLDHDLTLTLRPEVYTESHAFYADAVFDETRSTAELYAAAIRPLAAEALSGGAHATVMCFGQTGSGKTWTTLGILQELARDLPADVPAWRVSALEIAGSMVTDLLHAGAPCVLRDAGGTTHTTPAREHPAHPANSAAAATPSVGPLCPSARTSGAGVVVDSAAEAVAAILEGTRRRATSATTVHAASSRSHAVYRLEPLRTPPAAAAAAPPASTEGAAGEDAERTGEPTTLGGCLSIVDLAGSEWARDQSAHSSERIKETQEVNRSLMTLKACLAARSAAVAAAGNPAAGASARLPTRDTALTRVLRAPLEGHGKLLLIATTSPSSSDAEHVMSTLHHVGLSVHGGRGDAHGGGDGRALVVGCAGAGGRGAHSDAPVGVRILTRQARPESVQDTNGGGSTLPPDPCGWGTTEVVRWWLHATAAAAAALNSAVRPASADGDVNLLLRSADWPARTKLGLSFEHALGEGDEAPPVVSKISANSPLSKHETLAPGAQLIGCFCTVGGRETERSSEGSGRTAVLAALKAGGIALYRAADAAESGGDAAEQVELSLRFAPPAPCRAAPPRVPRTFSGMSRMDVGKGADLLSAFADPAQGLKKWTEACDGDGALAAALYSELRGMAEPFGGTPEERLEADRVKRAAAVAEA